MKLSIIFIICFFVPVIFSNFAFAQAYEQKFLCEGESVIGFKYENNSWVKRIWKPAKYIVNVICVLLISIFGFNTIWESGAFKIIEPHFNGECERIYGLNGPEDITIFNNGIALISSDHRWNTLSGNPVQGHIYMYDLNDNNPSLLDITPTLDFDFHPHGISVYENNDGSAEVLAINHRKDESTIEVFHYNNNELVFMHSIKDDLLISPNDLVLINKNEFYLTNDHGNSSNFLKMFEDYLQLSKSNVLYFNGNSFRPIISELSYANGINISKDKSKVYITETTGKSLSIYQRNTASDDLVLLTTIDLDSGADNIEVDESENIWIGSHPKMLKFISHAIKKKKITLSNN